MTSEILKAEALAFLRYIKRMPIVCSEVGSWNADVLGISPVKSIEIEVKVSKSDLRAEFRNKASKHFRYNQADKAGVNKSVPNYFYIFVPEALGGFAEETISGENSKAGIIIYGEDGQQLTGRNAKIIKNGQKLHGEKPGKNMIYTATMRMSSELCGLWQSVCTWKSHYDREFRRHTDAVVGSSYKINGGLDFEALGEGLEIRARELAAAVQDLSWGELSDEQRQTWRRSAQKLAAISDADIKRWEDATFSY